jgi:hypothetical protein
MGRLNRHYVGLNFKDRTRTFAFPHGVSETRFYRRINIFGFLKYLISDFVQI